MKNPSKPRVKKVEVEPDFLIKLAKQLDNIAANQATTDRYITDTVKPMVNELNEARRLTEQLLANPVAGGGYNPTQREELEIMANSSSEKPLEVKDINYKVTFKIANANDKDKITNAFLAELRALFIKYHVVKFSCQY